MPVRISIDRKNNSVAFQKVSVSQSDTVFWMNNDPKAAHWPELNGVQLTLTQLAPAPSDNSTSWSVATSNTAPFTITYGCCINGHSGETGTIEVYADLAPAATTAFTGTVGAAFTQAVSQGGLGPYTFDVPQGYSSPTQTYGVPPGLKLTSQSAGIVLSGTPSAAGNYLFTLSVTDSAQNNFSQQNYTVVIA